MNNKGFTLIELLGCLVLLGAILGISLYMTRDTLSTALSTLTDVSTTQIYNASEMYVLENKVTWINDGEEYTCITVNNLIEKGYFEEDEVKTYKDKIIRVERDSLSKTINSVRLVDKCN